MPRTWKKTGPSEYTSNDGHRVYKYHSRSGWDVVWGVQPKGSFGEPVGCSKKFAMEYLERIRPFAPSDDQFLSALGPCGR